MSEEKDVLSMTISQLNYNKTALMGQIAITVQKDGTVEIVTIDSFAIGSHRIDINSVDEIDRLAKLLATARERMINSK